jgi:hypothetical protein
MWASVEAIFLSTFVLISENRMQTAANQWADLDLQISLLAPSTRLQSLSRWCGPWRRSLPEPLLRTQYSSAACRIGD